MDIQVTTQSLHHGRMRRDYPLRATYAEAMCRRRAERIRMIRDYGNVEITTFGLQVHCGVEEQDGR